jgi:hypothetical protein
MATTRQDENRRPRSVTPFCRHQNAFKSHRKARQKASQRQPQMVVAVFAAAEMIILLSPAD